MLTRLRLTSPLSIARLKMPKLNGASNSCGNNVKISIRMVLFYPGILQRMLGNFSLNDFHGMRYSRHYHLEALLYRPGTARQVDDETLPALTGHRPAQHRHGRFLQ